jgi:hypothetical protein
VPATGAEPDRASDASGAHFTAVGVGVRHCAVEGEPEPSVFVHLGGWNKDADVDLRPHDARRVADNILAAVALLEQEADWVKHGD